MWLLSYIRGKTAKCILYSEKEALWLTPHMLTRLGSAVVSPHTSHIYDVINVRTNMTTSIQQRLKVTQTRADVDFYKNPLSSYSWVKKNSPTGPEKFDLISPEGL